MPIAGVVSCQTTVGELFERPEIRRSMESAHRRASEGERCPVAFTLGDTKYRGIVAPLYREDGSIAGAVLAAFHQCLVDIRCQSIAETLEQRMLFLKPDGTIEDINRTSGSIRPEELVGESIYDFIPPAERSRLRSACAAVLHDGTPRTLELKSHNKLGQTAWESLQIGAVSAEGRTLGLVILATDVTQRKQAAKELKEEEVFLKQLLELQERERQLVACEVHDGLVQDVIGARMLLDAIRDQVADSACDLRPPVDRALQLLAKAVAEGRRLISELRPMIIDEMGLIEAIHYLVEEEVSRGDVEVNFEPRVSFERLEPLLQATVFRVVREAVTNARRHGKAKRIEIRMTEVGAYVILEIQDNGCGFDPSQVAADRYGLQGIRERTQLFGGGATVESTPGKGARVTVKLPTNIPDTPNSGRSIDPPDWRWSI